jgi:hypothetical protein
MRNRGPGGETKIPNRRFAPAVTAQGDCNMKKALVILASVLALGTAGISAASARTVIIKKGGHHHGWMHHHHGGKTVIIKHGHRHGM